MTYASTNTDPAPPTVRPGAWRFGDGRPNLPGVRIDTGASMIFIADEHVLHVAEALADHLTRKRNRA